MTAPTLSHRRPDADGFRHEALFYEGDDGFVNGTVPFTRDGVRRGEDVLVVVSERKIGLRRERLGAGADDVRFADMADIGANPARIIPEWRAFAEVKMSSMHAGIGYVTPDDEHEGRGPAIREAREAGLESRPSPSAPLSSPAESAPSRLGPVDVAQ